MDWISVEESYPEVLKQFQMFIVATDKGIGVAYYDGMNGFSSIKINGNVQYSEYKISHWMHMPKHPEQ